MSQNLLDETSPPLGEREGGIRGRRRLGADRGTRSGYQKEHVSRSSTLGQDSSES